MKTKYSILTAAALISMHANAQTNQHALTVAGGHQGQIGNYIFEFSVGQPFTRRGRGQVFGTRPGFYNLSAARQRFR